MYLFNNIIIMHTNYHICGSGGGADVGGGGGQGGHGLETFITGLLGGISCSMSSLLTEKLSLIMLLYESFPGYCWMAM